MVADYFLIRGKQLDVESLYMRNGIYEYRSGFNPRAIAALVVGVGLRSHRPLCSRPALALRLCMVCGILRLWRPLHRA